MHFIAHEAGRVSSEFEDTKRKGGGLMAAREESMGDLVTREFVLRHNCHGHSWVSWRRVPLKRELGPFIVACSVVKSFLCPC